MRKPITAATSIASLLVGALLASTGCTDAVGPQFGSTVSLSHAPPPISGGTLLAMQDGVTAVAADPDRDTVSIVDLPSHSVRATLALEPGDEPGRLVEDGVGRVHVALRGGQSIVTIDPVAGRILDRRVACPAPRGIAWEPGPNRLHVACAGGELVSFSADGGPAIRSLKLDRDLRDVVVDGDHLLITRFRAAELLVVDQYGAVAPSRISPKASGGGSFFNGEGIRGASTARSFTPAVAWRAIPAPGGGVYMVHQRGVGDDKTNPNSGIGGGSVSTNDGGYGAGPRGPTCASGIVHSTISRLSPNGSELVASPFISSLVLPVDMALSPDQTHIAVVAAGNSRLLQKPSVLKIDLTTFFNGGECVAGETVASGGQVVAVAYTPAGALLVQRREPATVDMIDTATIIELSRDSREDTGHAVFHSNSGGDIACASCHPEGGEDGRTWQFDQIGMRRTQSLRGGVMALAPFHWTGDMPDLRRLTDQVFVKRMSGPALGDDQLGALSSFLNAVPAITPSAPVDPAAAERGRTVFNDPSVGCASCHNGAMLTNKASVDVGTGGAFQVPSLRGVAARAPFIHNGCAKTLADRFSPWCGGGDRHGVTAQLSDPQKTDLVSYLETL